MSLYVYIYIDIYLRKVKTPTSTRNGGVEWGEWSGVEWRGVEWGGVGGGDFFSRKITLTTGLAGKERGERKVRKSKNKKSSRRRQCLA
ncbi:hypothetical protein CEXT_319791 [Caerostris extrusa]|uniref:Uncharacterized protein n=1 Tax=Caerostris extrusa TaxID=172846 RepID=A0AAV4M5A4_CAEEX|nr:hypothetical protein CEXT_319791 [Caerostris extrusa]